MSDLEARLATMETRLRSLEDQMALLRLVSSYGPAVDGDLPDEASEIWTEDGEYDWGAGDRLKTKPPGVIEGPGGGASSRSEIAAMVRGDHHQNIIAGGSAHILSVPHVTIDGDRAVATNYSRLYRHKNGEVSIVRLSANRWEFVRTPEGWRTKRRIVRWLDGSQDARDLLREGLLKPDEPA